MFNLILIVFAAVFAVIGAMTLLYAAACSLRSLHGCGSRAEVVLYISEGENAEGIVREYASRLCSGFCGIRADALVVVYSGPGGETLEILKRLEGDISILSVCGEAEYPSRIKAAIRNL